MSQKTPTCPVCGNENTREIIIPGYMIPDDFYESTSYECGFCETVWTQGKYVVDFKGRRSVAKDFSSNHKEETRAQP